MNIIKYEYLNDIILNYQNKWRAVKRKMKGKRKNRDRKKGRPIFPPFSRFTGDWWESLFYSGPDICLPDEGDADEAADLKSVRIFEGEFALVGLAVPGVVDESSVP